MFGPSLAHVAIERDGEEEVLGQAWIAAPNTVITCAHVVDQYVRNRSSLVIKFPASGNRYPIKDIKLHPSFQRHENELLRFDLAAITIDFIEPETNARPLPIVFEKPLEQHQDLSAVRYPSHLGLYTTSLFPLSQIGRVLRLKPNDRFHLFHDVALAPGDSGTPLFDGEHVVAVHCGDTATAPVLDIPISSIRLAVSVDALMALGISESKGSAFSWGSIIGGVAAFLLCAVITLGAFAYPHKNAWNYTQTPKLGVDISYNQPIKAYQYGDPFTITLYPKSNCDLYLFYIDGNDASILFPPRGTGSAQRDANKPLVVDGFGTRTIQVGDTVGELHVVALRDSKPLLKPNEVEKIDTNWKLPIKRDELLARINLIEKTNPQDILHEAIDAPRADNPDSDQTSSSEQNQTDSTRVTEQATTQTSVPDQAGQKSDTASADAAAAPGKD